MRFLFGFLLDIVALIWIIVMIMSCIYIFYGQQGMIDVVRYLYYNICVYSDKIIN